MPRHLRGRCNTCVFPRKLNAMKPDHNLQRVGWNKRNHYPTTNAPSDWLAFPEHRQGSQMRKIGPPCLTLLIRQYIRNQLVMVTYTLS